MCGQKGCYMNNYFDVNFVYREGLIVFIKKSVLAQSPCGQKICFI